MALFLLIDYFIKYTTTSLNISHDIISHTSPVVWLKTHQSSLTAPVSSNLVIVCELNKLTAEIFETQHEPTTFVFNLTFVDNFAFAELDMFSARNAKEESVRLLYLSVTNYLKKRVCFALCKK